MLQDTIVTIQKELGLSDNKMALALGITRQTWRNWRMGRTIPLAACVSGHKSWQSLQRYAHIRQTGDKYANWDWMPKKTPH